MRSQTALRLRKHWLAVIDSQGGVVCWRCGQMIMPGQPVDLGHLVDVALGGTEQDGIRPEHRACNRRAGGELSVALREEASRSWTCVVSPADEPDALFGVPAPDGARSDMRPVPMITKQRRRSA